MTNFPIPVTDFLSNLNDQIANAAKVLIRAKQRQAVFKAVYRGKKHVKTISEIMNETGLSQIRVLQEGRKLGLLVEKVQEGYRKRKEFTDSYKRILALANNKKKLEQLPTKVSPKINVKGLSINVVLPSSAKHARHITIDEIDSFSKIRNVKKSEYLGSIEEEKLKEGFKKIIGDRGDFKDWGGEKSDLYTTRVVFMGKRVASAIAFKGKGTKGKLVPSKMGKNGNQIDRLFDEPAQIFLIVYNGQIDSYVVSQMQAFAIAKKALNGQKVYYGVIDGNDLGRLFSAYPDFLIQPHDSQITLSPQ